MTVTVVTDVTALVVIVKVVPVAPAGTVALVGVVADPLLSDSVTTLPPPGDGPVKVAVPVEEFPPAKLAGFREIEESAGGLIVRVVNCGPL